MRTFPDIIGNPSLSPQVMRSFAAHTVINTRKMLVRKLYGERIFSEIASRLSPDAKGYLVDDFLHKREWHPIGPLIELDRAIVAGPMRGNAHNMLNFAGHIAEQDLSGFLKIFIMLAGQPLLVLKNMVRVYGKYWSPGEISRGEFKPGHVIFRLQNGTLPWYLCEFGISGWVERAAGIAGGKGVIVRHTTCRHSGDKECCWDVRWG